MVCNCKDKCEKLPYHNKKPKYERGDKWCSRCSTGFTCFASLFCPCCGQRLKTKRRESHRYTTGNWERNRMPTEEDFRTMTLPQLEQKYPRIRNRF